MRILGAFLLVLSCCAFAASECIEVTGPETKPSSQNVKITVLQDGKPQGNVRLTVILPEGHGTRSFVTDSYGTAALKGLPAGRNCVTAVGEGQLRADLCLAVSKKSGARASSITLAISDGLPSLPALSNAQAAGGSAVPERLRQLDLVVLDLAGGFVPHAEIGVYKRESYPGNLVTKAWTDENGRFTVPLNPGAYAVTIRMGGFKVALRVIEIAPDGREGQVRQVLQLGGC